MDIPIIGDFFKKKPVDDIETPEIMPPPDFSHINVPAFSESHYRSIERMGQIESKPDMLRYIEDSDWSRQAKDGAIMWIKNNYDSNLMYSDLSDGNNFDIAGLRALIDQMVCCIGTAYKSDRRRDDYAAFIAATINQIWRRDTRTVGINRERALAAAIEFKYSTSKKNENTEKK